MPSLNNRRERFLTQEEADLLLKELWGGSKSVHDQALLSLHCGLMAGEIFNLRGQDLDFENGIIRVMDPKDKTNRAAYMTQAVREMLKKRIPKDASKFYQYQSIKIRFLLTKAMRYDLLIKSWEEKGSRK